MTTSKGLLGVVTVLALAGAANAALTITGLGTISPVGQAATAGMTAFALFDSQPVFADVTSSDSPLGGAVGFDQPLSHRNIGFGWGSWSHGYTGSVFFGGGTSITLTMPANTGGFYLYAEPNNFGVFQMQVSATNAAGESAMSPIIGVEGSAGAAGWAFTSTSALLSITVTNTDGGAAGFAVGEFGIAEVPAPGALALLGLAGLAGRRRRA